MFKNIYKFGLMCLAMVFAAACTQDAPVDTYFSIEEGYMNYSVGYDKVAKADSKIFTVRSNKSWELVGVEDYDWLKPFPNKGEGDGRFCFVIDENMTLEEREAIYTLIIDGEEYPRAITVSQATRGEFVEASVKSFQVLAPENIIKLKVKKNVEVQYRVLSDDSGTNGSWITFPAEQPQDKDSLYIKVAESTLLKPRKAKIAISMTDKLSVADTLTIQQIGTQELYGYPAKWKFEGIANDDNFIAAWQTTNYVPSDEGFAFFSYVAVDAITDKYKHDISGGDPRVTGAWPGDYWLYEVPSIVPANTMFSISFAARCSATGHKFWILEYLDGEEWMPVGTALTTSEPGVPVAYTHVMKNADQIVGGTFKVKNRMNSLKIRYRCVANWTVGNDTTPSAALSARNGGTVRMSHTSPLEIKKLATGVGDEAQLEMSAYHVALEGVSGSQGSFKIKSSESWSLTSTADWFEFTPSSGNANVQATVTVKAKSANATGLLRKAKITLTTGLTTKEIEVIQGSVGGGSTEPEVPTEPEVTDLYAEWLFSANAQNTYANTFGGYLETSATFRKDQGDGGLYVPSSKGNGTIKYVQIDKTGIDVNDKVSSFVGESGHPVVTGVWPGDYWLFEATDDKEYPAGTQLSIHFETRISGTGQMYWMLEYWDGEAWKPSAMVQTASIGENSVEYNFMPSTKSTANSIVDFTWTLAKPCKIMQFRYKCMANWNKDGALAAPNGGTCRIAGAAGTSPVFRVVK